MYKENVCSKDRSRSNGERIDSAKAVYIVKKSLDKSGRRAEWLRWFVNPIDR